MPATDIPGPQPVQPEHGRIHWGTIDGTYKQEMDARIPIRDGKKYRLQSSDVLRFIDDDESIAYMEIKRRCREQIPILW